ncbi:MULTISPECIES: MetQ/NlpA family ABC transporter substrate-binding protein [unclassified Jeotgalibaca]|uniref:MetQ/NlpA family ABC transporter substrate-binding protein n=1 Tax=unclassified Jeotgalibaca TaxID=2621505 RepID=UPI003FD3E4EE
MKKRILSLMVLLAAGISLTACGNSDAAGNAEEKTTIKVGTSPGPYSELFLEGIAPILEEEGYTIEVTDFTDLRSADMALHEGAVDINVDQHLAYMNNFNAESDAHLTPITPIPTVPTGMYSENKDSVDEVANGDKIAIPDDASNAARALLLLEKAGWIKLDEEVEPMQSTPTDIIDNPHKLEIIEMGSAQIPRSLADVAYGVIPGSMLYAAGMSSNDSLLNEDILPDLILHAVVNEGQEDTAWTQAVVDAYKSEDFKDYMADVNFDNYWFIPEELKQ